MTSERNRIKELPFLLIVVLSGGLVGGMSAVLSALLETNGLWPPSIIVLWALLITFIGISILSAIGLFRCFKMTVTPKTYISMSGMFLVLFLAIRWALECISALF